MIPTSFDYVAPESLDEAVALLQKHGDDAKVLTGGQSLIPLLRLRLARPGVVVDLRKLSDLGRIESAGEALEIGAAATHAEVMNSAAALEKCPLLSETAGEIGDVQVRNTGTIGGSLVHADPAADWPAAMLALGATMVLSGPQGERAVAAEDFFVGLLESAAQPGEILTGIRVTVPRQPAARAYRKLAQSASGFALAGAAVQLALDGDTIAEARIGITGVAEHAYRPREVEAALTGGALDASSVETACASAAEGVEVLEDIHAGAAYRGHLASVLTKRAVLAAIERAHGHAS